MKQQIIRIIFGFVVAELVTTGFVSVYFLHLIEYYKGHPPYGINVRDVFRAFPDMGFFTIMFTFLPFVIFIALTERYSWRSLSIYIAFGTLLPSLMLGAASPFHGFSGKGFEYMIVLGGIGAAACFIYWLIAGRHAGLWKQPVA
jgi:hypothetical protein